MLGQRMITRHHVRHVVERLYDVLEGLALRIGAQRRRVDVGRGPRLLRQLVHLMRDILTLESIWNRSLKEVVALLEDRALDAFAANCVDDELVVCGLRTVSLIISWVAVTSRHRLRL